MPKPLYLSLLSLTTSRCFGAADAGTGTHTGTMTTAEFVTYRLKEGISNKAFVQAASAINSYLRESGNVMSRSLSCGDDGLWTDHIVWKSMKTAEETAAMVMQKPEFGQMSELIDPDSMNLRYASILMQMD